MDFRASAALGDTIETRVAVESFGNTSMTVGFTTTRLSDGVVVTEGKEIIVFVDPETFRPQPIPDEVKARLGNPQVDRAVG